MLGLTSDRERSDDPLRWPRWTRRLGVGALIVGVGLIVATITLPPAEPTHEGVGLSKILEDLNGLPGSASYVNRSNALMALRVEAPAFVVHQLGSEPLALRFYDWVAPRLAPVNQRRLARRLNVFSRLNVIAGAHKAVAVLGSNMAPEADSLMRVYRKLPYQGRASLAYVLPKVGPAVVPGLIPELTHPEVRVRSLAAFVVHELGPSATNAAPALIAGITGADANHERLVVQCLGRLGPAIMPLVRAMLDDERPERKVVGLRALQHWAPRPRQETPRIVQLLDDPVLDVRVQAAFLLAEWWPKPLRHWTEKLGERPSDDPLRVQLHAGIEALERGEDRWIAVLLEGLQHPDPGQRLISAEDLLRVRPQPDSSVVECLELLVNLPSLEASQRSRAMHLLNRARTLSLNDRG